MHAMQDYKVKIDSIRLVNYKRFLDETVTFEPTLTVLIGQNGAGKSSVLSGVTLFLSWIIARLRNENGVGLYIPALAVNNSARNGCVIGNIFNGTVTVPNKAKPGFARDYTLGIQPIKEYVMYKRAQLLENKATSLPVFASYGVQRAVLDIPVRTRSQEYSMFDAYDKCTDGSTNFRGFFTWFRACEDWENQMTVRSGSTVEHAGLRAFRRAMERFMPEYRDVYIERHPLGMMLKKDGMTLNAEQLSDGEKIYLALIGDLCHRLSLANPEGDPLLGEGIVLIDEVDLHLHPKWQSEIAVALTRTFPNVQFILTTHSPHVINGVPTESLRIINNDGSISRAPYGYGMPSEVVLGDLMNLAHDVPNAVFDMVNNFNAAVVENNLPEARAQLLALQESVPQHPELPRMRKRVERLAR